MRKGTLLLAVLLAACFTSTADAAKKKKAPAAKPAAAATNPNASGMKFVGDAFSQILVPGKSLTQPRVAAAPAKAKRGAKKKKT